MLHESPEREPRGTCPVERATPLSRRPKPRGDAVDGREQGRELVFRRLLAPRRAIAPQQLDLLAAHLVQRSQAARHALAGLGKPIPQPGATGEAGRAPPTPSG